MSRRCSIQHAKGRSPVAHVVAGDDSRPAKRFMRARASPMTVERKCPTCISWRHWAPSNRSPHEDQDKRKSPVARRFAGRATGHPGMMSPGFRLRNPGPAISTLATPSTSRAPTIASCDLSRRSSQALRESHDAVHLIVRPVRRPKAGQRRLPARRRRSGSEKRSPLVG